MDKTFYSSLETSKHGEEVHVTFYRLYSYAGALCGAYMRLAEKARGKSVEELLKISVPRAIFKLKELADWPRPETDERHLLDLSEQEEVQRSYWRNVNRNESIE